MKKVALIVGGGSGTRMGTDIPKQFLLLNGADPNTADFGGNTVLMGAAFKGDLEIVNLLVEHNAHIYLKNHSLMTALDYSILFGRKNVELYLKMTTKTAFFVILLW